MNVIEIDIFSTRTDNVYVKHIESLAQSIPDVKFNYCIGNKSNCNKHKICSSDTLKNHSTLIHCYTRVPNYQRIEDTFYFVNPAFNFVRYQDKIIAYPSTVTKERLNHILGYLIVPHDSESITNIKPMGRLKDGACCSNRVCIYLK